MRTIQLFSFGKDIAGYKGIRIRRDSEWNEFCVESILVDGTVSEKDTYFTDDKEDAVDTAQFKFNQMLREAK